MKTLDVAEFRKTVASLTEPVIVTKYRKPLGTWTPAGAQAGQGETQASGIGAFTQVDVLVPEPAPIPKPEPAREEKQAPASRTRTRTGFAVPARIPDAENLDAYRQFRPAPKPTSSKPAADKRRY
jgi:hypothetical protein